MVLSIISMIYVTALLTEFIQLFINCLYVLICKSASSTKLHQNFILSCVKQIEFPCLNIFHFDKYELLKYF